MPTLLVADDSELIRKTVKRLLEAEPAIEILGEATNFAETIQKAAELKPDIVLLDLHMPDERFLDADYIKTRLRPLGSRSRSSASRCLAMRTRRRGTWRQAWVLARFSKNLASTTN